MTGPGDSRQLLQALAAGFRERYFRQEAAFMRRIALQEGHRPEALFIGCSDARAVPELLVDAKPGDLFVVRNVANLVPPFGTSESSVGAAIEFAVGRLELGVVVVCGHLDCQGIRMLDEPRKLSAEPTLSRWLELARPAQTMVDARYTLKPEARHRAIVKANVLLQLDRLRSYDVVRAAAKPGRLALEGWVYDVGSGRVTANCAESDEFVDLEALE